MRNVSDKISRKKSRHILGSVTFFLNRAVYETMWINAVEPGMPQMTIWRMRVACSITKDTNSHSEYVLLIAFPLHNGCTNAPQCYVIRTLPVLFDILLKFPQLNFSKYAINN